MENIENLIKDTFGSEVTCNLWNASRLYINLDVKTSFSYDLTQGLKISSKELLAPHVFKKAKSIVPQLKTLLEHI